MSHTRPGLRFRALGQALALAVGAAVALGCASTGSPVTGVAQIFGRSAPTVQAWNLPPEVYPSQRLYRVRYQGPEGKLGFRLTLYLASPEQYRMDAADTLGRQVWSLAIEPDDQAVWVDHRREEFCRTRGASEQTFVPIAYLPLEALPRLILGRMPARPLGEVEMGEGKIVYRDDQGQTWNGVESEGQLEWWSLLREGEAVAWWRRHGDENIFSDRRGGQQVRWTEQVAETLATPLESLEIPERYREGICGSALEQAEL